MTNASASQFDTSLATPNSVGALVEQLGLPETELAPGRIFSPATNPAEFLAAHRDAVVIAQEWPVILKAAELTRLGFHRDLLALDKGYATQIPKNLAEASFRVGRRQLARLRGLKDQRIIQKYLDAIERGEAHGWNPVVFGIVLSVYGIPFRQGLVHYATAILRGYARQLPSIKAGPGFEHLFEKIEAPLQTEVNRLLSNNGSPALMVA